MYYYQDEHLSKQLEAYLLFEMRQIRKQKLLKEAFWDDWTISDYGHIGLDVVAIVSSFVPGPGSAISTIADLGNAAWYFTEGKPVTAALYVLMSIPIVGDILALPFQMVLNLGGKGLMKIPGLKTALAHLIERSSFVKGFLTKLIGESGAKGISKSAEEIISKRVAKKAEKDATKKMAEGTKELITNLEKASEKGGEEAAVRQLELEFGREAKGVAQPSVIPAEKAAKLSKKVEQNVAGKTATKAEKEIAKQIEKEAAEQAAKKGEKTLGQKAGEAVGGIFGKAAIKGITRAGGKAITGYFDPKVDMGGKENSAGVKTPADLDCPDDAMKKGCAGKNVMVIQGYLKNLGYNTSVSGKFDNATDAAVKKLQKDYGLEASGIVDYFTIAKIEELLTSDVKTKTQQVMPGSSSSSVESDLFERKNTRIIRKRNEEIEQIVFQRLVGQCK